MFRPQLVRSVFAMAAALAAVQPAYAQSTALAGSEWRPTVIEDVDVAVDSGIFIQFGADGKVSGSGGCNRFTGAYELAGDTIAFSPLAATRRACPQPIMANESRFFDALDRAKRFSRERLDLELADETGNPVILLVQTDAD